MSWSFCTMSCIIAEIFIQTSFDSVATPITDSTVKGFHFFQDMRYFQFQLPNGTAVQTCPAALGYAFAAGTTDGPGPFDFTQNDPGAPNANPLWSVVSKLLRNPTPEQTACQQPKPILLDVGEMDTPYAWSPNIVDVQLLRVGQFIIIVSPSEASTMAGRRWKNAIAEAASSQNITSQEPMVVLGSPANTYAHYLTTPEEYGVQRYEGASTLYGQWELAAYINLTVSNIKYLSSASDSGPEQGPLPPDNRKNSLSFISPVVLDSPPIGKSFGDVLTQPKLSYTRGDIVNVTFVGANPRNNLRLEDTYTVVEQLQNGQWVKVRDDWDWSLSMTWTRENTILGTSNVDLTWESETDTDAGTYRFRYYGDSKNILGHIDPIEGISNSFILV
jgi:neutral ceramidase